MPELAMDLVYITASTELIPIVGTEPTDYVTDIYGKLHDWDAGIGEEIIMGQFLFYILDPLAHSEGSAQSYFEVLDKFGLIKSYPALLNTMSSGKDDYQSQKRNGNKLLLFDHLVISPEYRGRNLGLAVMARLIYHFAGDSNLVVIHPFPTQYSGSAHRDGEPEPSPYGNMSIEDATNKLVCHWAQIGFEQVSGHWPYMVMSPTRIIQSTAELLKGSSV